MFQWPQYDLSIVSTNNASLEIFLERRNFFRNFEKLFIDSDSSTSRVLDHTVLNNPSLKIESPKFPLLSYQVTVPLPVIWLRNALITVTSVP